MTHYEKIAKIFKSLLDGQSSKNDLAEASGMSESTVRLYMQAFQSERVTRLAGKEVPPGMRPGARQALYELNPDNRPDARIKKASDSERTRAYRLRRRQRDAKLLGLKQCETSQ